MNEWIDCKALTEDDRAMTFGEEFRHQIITRACFDGAAPMVEILLNGQLVMLVGDQQKALETYLGGNDAAETLQ